MGPDERTVSRDAPDRRYADTGQVVNLAVGQVLLQQLDHLPAILERLQLRRGAEVLEEIAALVDRSQADDGFEKRVLGRFLAALTVVTVRLHRVLMY